MAPGSIFGRQSVFYHDRVDFWSADCVPTCMHVRGHFQSVKEEKEIDLVVA